MTTQEAKLSIINSELNRIDTELQDKGRSLAFELKDALLSDFEMQKGESKYKELKSISRMRQLTQELSTLSSQNASTHPLFVFSPSQVYEAFKHATASKHERLHFSFGYQLKNVIISTRFVPLKLDDSMLTFAKANLEHSTDLLIEAENQYGEQLTIYWHAHPGGSSNCNRPSSIDIETQSRYEKGGYTVIGGIFSRGGHLRFFSNQIKFEISIVGKGVQKIGNNQYKLTRIN